MAWGGGFLVNGSGHVHIWAKVAFTASGNALYATSQACGSSLPSATLILNLGRILIEIPNDTWDLSTMPRFVFKATQSGWNVGSTLNYTYSALIGVDPTDPTTDAATPWPDSYAGIAATDPDGDGKPGVTAVPRSGGGFVAPPTMSLLASVDRVYIVLRNTSSVIKTRTTCDRASGTAELMHFDNHVVGCHVEGGRDCGPADVDFVDGNRTAYRATSATIESVVVPDTATCADVRAALPIN